MTSGTNEPTVENFFDNVGGGTGAPSQKLHDVNDGVIGTILSQSVVDYVPFGKTEPERLKDGSIRKQLVVVLQTDQRNWQGVSKIPVVDRDVPNSPQKHPSEDDGKRAVYLPMFSNIQAAVADAVRKSGAYGGQNGPIRNGGRLGVKVFNLKDTGKGNPLKEHQAVYEAPTASEGFFDNAPAAQASAQSAPPAAQASAQSAPPAQPAGDPWGGQQQQSAPAPAQQPVQQQAPAQSAPPAGDPWSAQAPPAAQGDPWASQGAGQAQEPPF